MEVTNEVRSTRHGRRPLISGIIWLALGIYLLLLFHDWIPPFDLSWPIILIIVGAALSVRGLTRK